LANEKVEGEPILAKAMENGSIVFRLPSLEEIRENALRNLSHLPSKYRKLRNAPLYPVELSFQLRKIKKALRDQLRSREGLP
jgi:nicotinate phosphoribosyltransferase